MDKGAHYYRCDFQVHSPRDARWAGAGAVSEEDRLSYAVELVKACREKGLNAIAITDHHDLAFVSYIRAAAADERDEHGELVPIANRLLVFPGIELTLAVPCQAILLFDSEFPEDMFTLALNALAIVTSDPSEAKTAQTVPLPEITTLSCVHQELDKHDYLRGRYILLPNVSEGGRHTLLRSGQAPKYRTMPCVGGYLDGSVEQLGTGNLNILSGKDQNYGSKKLALFQTSDNRRRDHADLGKHTTWVKWATPTAEALRQACLAQESRISQEVPVLPGMSLTALDVTNCSFFGPIHLEFSPQYTALIGGRGTGKSTLLEYLRWALCDQPPEGLSDVELPDFQRRRRGLVEATLARHGAVVEVRFLVNGISHAVRRESESGVVRLKIGDGQFEVCSEHDIRSLLPVQAYSQKQLSNVGVRVEELQRFITTPIRNELDEIDGRFKSLATEIRQEHAAILRKRAIETSISKDRLSVASLSDQAEILRKSLVNLSSEDRLIIAQNPRYEEAQQAMDAWSSDLESIEKGLRELERRTEELPTEQDVSIEDLPHTSLLKNAKQSVANAVESTQQAIESARLAVGKAKSADGAFGSALRTWTKELGDFMVKYNDAKGRSSTHESKLKELESLEARLKQTRTNITEARAQLAEVGAPTERYDKLRTEWKGLHNNRSTLLDAECKSLTSLSGGDIKATLRRGVGLDDVMQALRKATAGSGLRRDKLDAISSALEQALEPLNLWDRILEEFEIIATTQNLEGKSIPNLPLLESYGFKAKDIEKLISKLDASSWLELALTPMQDQPMFEFRAREEDYIPFKNASAGQQATALLKTLLNQPGPPLLIDQPEDDLDNPVILEVVEQVWTAKKSRQLIFSSHNANLVVNGDAELVVWCDHQTAGDHSKGLLAGEGAIDVDNIRDAIKKVMEGGEVAFKLRRDKYGF